MICQLLHCLHSQLIHWFTGWLQEEETQILIGWLTAGGRNSNIDWLIDCRRKKLKYWLADWLQEEETQILIGWLTAGGGNSDMWCDSAGWLKGLRLEPGKAYVTLLCPKNDHPYTGIDTSLSCMQTHVCTCMYTLLILYIYASSPSLWKIVIFCCFVFVM